MTFTNYRTRKTDDGRVLVTALCVENGKEAYAIVNCGSDAITRASEKFARLS